MVHNKSFQNKLPVLLFIQYTSIHETLLCWSRIKV